MKITLDSRPSDAPCCLKITAENGESLLIQTDWDWPGVARTDTINKAFDALRFVFDSAWQNHAEHLRIQCLSEERQHRSGDFAKYHTSDTISANQAAKLFAVKRVAAYLNGEKFPSGQDYLHTQHSCFLAAGIVDEFGAKVREAWKGFDLSALASLDYTDFVKVRQTA